MTISSDEGKGFFSGNTLKILAALFMVCDHVGMLILPQYIYLRYIGRLAYPIFAFFIAEGCRYTKNKAKYLGTMTVVGLVFHLVYYYATQDPTVNVIVSFALAIAMIFLWQYFIDVVKKKSWTAILWFFLWADYCVLCYTVTKLVHVDYYFAGILLPWLVYLSKNRFLRLGLFAVGIGLVCQAMGEYASVEVWGLLSVPMIACYNGRRGQRKMKYFFYIFYPSHLVILYGISLLIYR